MKNKIFVSSVFILFFGIIKCDAQINNLNDFLTVSEMSLPVLVENLQYSWNFEHPYQEFSNDNKFVSEYEIFKFKGVRDQTLKRITSGYLESEKTIYTTELICNDKELLNRIKNNLRYWEFELKESNVPNYYIYSDGNSLIKIQLKALKGKPLKNGYYSIRREIKSYRN